MANHAVASRRLVLTPEKQVYLKDGDMVAISIEKLGSMTNRMVKE